VARPFCRIVSSAFFKGEGVLRALGGRTDFLALVFPRSRLPTPWSGLLFSAGPLTGYDFFQVRAFTHLFWDAGIAVIGLKFCGPAEGLAHYGSGLLPPGLLCGRLCPRFPSSVSDRSTIFGPKIDGLLMSCSLGFPSCPLPDLHLP